MIHWSSKGKPSRRFYLADSKGIAARDIITSINRAPKNERTGYPTQKPLALYERLIRASTNKDEMVCDPFAGCATTCVAAERQGRKWVEIDIWDRAHEVVIERIAREGLLAESQDSGGISRSLMCIMRQRRLSAMTTACPPRPR